MKKFIIVALATLMFTVPNVNAANLEGDFLLYDPSGIPLIPPGSHPITGVVDFPNEQLIIDDFLFFGLPLSTTVLEILEPGLYTRVHNGVTLNATIDPGNIGAYMILTWNFEQLPMFMAWQPNSDSTVFTPTDVDGDGVPGMQIPFGPFQGISAVYEFTAEPAGPGVRLSLVVEGGTTQECAATGGGEVTINAVPQLFGGASLESISWSIDGADAGTGISITEFLSLGTHIVEATATTTTGETGTASINVTVRDTIAPDLQVQFLNVHGEPVESSGPGFVRISMNASDICDPKPTIKHSSATPSHDVVDGDILRVNASKGNLKLPTTSLRVDATAVDSSGNASSNTATLTLE